MKISAGLALTLLLSCVALAPAQAAAPLVPVDVDLGDLSLNKVSYLIASDSGIYARNGLDVHQYLSPAAAATAKNSGLDFPAAYIKPDAGNAPIALGSGTPMMYRVANDPKAVRRVVLTTAETIIRETIITTAGVERLEDLKGKRLGYSVPGTVTHVAALSFARQMGWDPNRDVSLIGNASGFVPLQQGRTDAFFGSAMAVSMSPELKLKLLIDLTQYKFPVAGSGIMAERDWLKQNHDTAAKFVKSGIEAVALMKKDRPAFDRALVKWFNIKDAATQDRIYREVADIPRKPYPSVDGIKHTLVIYDSPKMRELKPEELYDSSIVAELDKSGFIDQLYR